MVGLRISPIDRADTANPLITLAYVGAKSTGITLRNIMQFDKKNKKKNKFKKMKTPNIRTRTRFQQN